MSTTDQVTFSTSGIKLTEEVLSQTYETEFGTVYHRHPHGGGLVADDASVAPSVYVDFYAVVRPGAVIGAYAVVGSDTSIGAYARVYEGVRLGSYVQVHDSARILPNMKISDRASIGMGESVYEDR